MSGEGVLRIAALGEKNEFREWWLKLSSKSGLTWETVLPDGETERLELTGVEEVKVPAGTFHALRVEVSVPLGGPGIRGGADFRSRSTRWFAPGVGLIKASGRTWEHVMKSFTPATD